MANTNLFRPLKPEEVKVRFGSITEKGAFLFLYTEAKVCEKILDEAVGPLNWQKTYAVPNMCTISIWNDTLKEWISKTDVGGRNEGFEEQEKSMATDSFKRAASCWGIGRELYSLDFIWVQAAKLNIRKVTSNGKDRYVCNDRLTVSKISVNDDRNIVGLEITGSNGTVVYSYGNVNAKAAAPKQAEKKAETKAAPKQTAPAKDPLEAEIESELKRTGISKTSLVHSYGVPSIDLLSEEQKKDAIERLKKNPDRG